MSLGTGHCESCRRKEGSRPSASLCLALGPFRPLQILNLVAFWKKNDTGPVSMLEAAVWRLSPSVPGPGGQGLAGQEQCLYLSLTMGARFPGRGGNTRKATVIFLAIVPANALICPALSFPQDKLWEVCVAFLVTFPSSVQGAISSVLSRAHCRPSRFFSVSRFTSSPFSGSTCDP